MKDEIKEILETLKYCVEKNEYLEISNMKEWKPLLDYITNLQEENERLNNIISELENKIYYLYNYAGLDTSNLKNELQELKEEE